MSNKKILSVKWTEKALENATSIKVYLIKNYSQREVDTFYSLLAAFEDAVSIFPKLYPETNKRNIENKACCFE